ncbi:hypothetical protein PM8797T_03735 [Gimesia maris DSM 8797]|nr:hypothetical protein PM8797T_03735 [Gimesia maris DSM 8797]
MINRWLISLRLLFTVPFCRENGDCGESEKVPGTDCLVWLMPTVCHKERT